MFPRRSSWPRNSTGGPTAASWPSSQKTDLPKYDLPSEATRIQLDGKPAFHVTLIAKRVMEPYKDAMTTLWPAIAAAAPEPPVAQLGPELKKACDEEKQKTSWYVNVINADAYSEVSSRLGGSDRSPFANRWQAGLHQPRDGPAVSLDGRQ